MDSEAVMAARLTLDPNNANRGTVRGEGMVERSLQSYGAGRSILASKDGVILAGNKTFQKAQELGIPVQEIESDGRMLFVIRRTDLDYDDPRARELAIADNRASETGLEWDADVLSALAEDGVDLSQFWFEDELAHVLDHVDEPPSLDDLAAQYGDPDEAAFWPEIKVKVPPDTYDRYESIMADIDAPTDAERFARMLEVVNRAALQ